MLITTNISIAGKSIQQFRSLTLDQSINNHHRFTLICPAEAIDGAEGALFNTSGAWIGLDIRISITSEAPDGSLLFSGIITQVETCRHSGHAGDVVISGGSPTLLLDSGPQCSCWEQRALKSIVTDVLKPYPQNRLHPLIAPSYREAISYMVQYKESTWQFIKRLAATYGEWLFYNGQQLIIGPPNEPVVPLKVGVHLSRFNLSMQARPVDWHYQGYDYTNHKIYESISDSNSIGASGWMHQAAAQSRDLYETQSNQWTNHIIRGKKELDDLVHIRSAIETSLLVRCHGASDLPCLYPGKQIHVTGKNIFNNIEEAYGEFVVAEVSHVCNGQGHYSNAFVAVPASVKAPPVTYSIDPRCETQSAVVTDNYDKKGLGRVRVRFYWMNKNEQSPWLRVTLPHAGKAKGFFILPEVGDEVIVAFEGDHPCLPFVIGSVYHGKATCDLANEENDFKVFRTRSGSEICIDDKKGSLLLRDKDNNTLTLDGTGSIQVDSKQSLLLRCGSAEIEMKQDGTIMVNGKDMQINGSGLVAVNGAMITLN